LLLLVTQKLLVATCIQNPVSSSYSRFIREDYASDCDCGSTFYNMVLILLLLLMILCVIFLKTLILSHLQVYK